MGGMKLTDQLASLNAAAAALDSPCFTRFRLEEDTVVFDVASGAARGVVNLSLHERSHYPQTGALLFADGSDALLAAVEAVTARVAESAALGGVLTSLASKLWPGGVPPAPEQLESYVTACGGAAESSQPEAASSACGFSAGRPDDCGNGCDHGGDELSDGDESSGDSGSDGDEDDHYDLGFAKGDELDDRLLRMRLAWEEKDAGRRAAAAPRLHVNDEGTTQAPAGSGASSTPACSTNSEAEPAGAAAVGKLSAMEIKRRGDKAAAAGRKRGAAAQIFSSAEATRILCNELSSLIREQAEGFEGINADCVELDVHQWRVQICDITPGCPLEADFAQLRRTHGYGHIELGLRFQADMHPFYPVHLQVLRPRFEGVVAEALMSHPIFSLQGWDPMKSIKEMLRFAQKFLETHGRVALGDPRNGFPLGPGGATSPGAGELYPTPAYSPAEMALCRLELLAGLRPVWAKDAPALLRARDEAVDTERIRELNFGKRQKRAAPPAARGGGGGGTGGWESGVGYAHSGTEGGQTWDVATAEAAQAHQDVETRALLSDVTAAAEAGQISRAVVTGSCLLALLWQNLRCGSLLDVGSRPERALMFSHMLSLVRAVGNNHDISFLVEAPPPGTAETPDAARAAGVHRPPGTIREALQAVARQAEFILARQAAADEAASSAEGSAGTSAASPARGSATSTATPADTAAAVAEAVAATIAAETAAQAAMRAAGAASAAASAGSRGKVEDYLASVSSSYALGRRPGSALLGSAPAVDEVYMVPLARHIVAVAKDLEDALSHRQPAAPVDTPAVAEPDGRRPLRGAQPVPQSIPTTSRSTRRTTAAAAASAAGRAPPVVSSNSSSSSIATLAAGAAGPSGGGSFSDGLTHDERYIQRMTPLQFEAVEDIPGHHYLVKGLRMEALPARSRRLALEAADMMGGSLPVAASSTIWCRLHEAQMHIWRAMISGPDGTPYAGGLFIFDILCSSDYPNSAPKVNLCTTGGGSVRFNPNLYNCGKVCLSLLGTWQGDQAESWHPKTSTLLQVLMSVQALILVPDPFFNEPGYERIRGTPDGNRQAREYNEVIREATIRYAMIDILRKPPPELRQAILSHFALRRADILANVRAMAAEKSNSKPHADRMDGLVKQLEEAIDTHAPPSVLAQA